MPADTSGTGASEPSRRRAGRARRQAAPASVAVVDRSFVIAITTYRRPDSLRRLLTSFDDLSWPTSWRFGGLLVVDNDPAATARPVVDSYRRDAQWPVRYVVEETPGVVASRNRALAEATDVSHVAMIDDDEIIHPGWPSGLLEVAERTGAELTGGLVVPLPEAEVPEWMLRPSFLGRDPHPDGAEVRRVSSGNVLIDRARLAGVGVPLFDPRFARSGGEDSYLSATIRAEGGTLRWSATARTYEVFPAERCSLAWLRQRWRRTGATMVMVDLALATDRADRLRRRIRAAATGAARIAYSLLPLGGSEAVRAARVRHRMLGIGQLAGALGSTPMAYGPGGFESPS